MMATILVGMSGGVDSSVAAALLVEAGHEVIGVSLQLYDHSAGGRLARCCSPEDFIDARRVAAALGIRYYVINKEEAFSRHVLDDFVAEYRRGRTPNPCVRCNSSVKFETLVRLARGLSATAVATGHYARVFTDPATGRRSLLRACDRAKDQSYFLFNLTDEQVRLAMFPLGELSKQDVRLAARRLGLETADKVESQDVCFVEGGDYREFLRRRLEESGEREAAGPIVDSRGKTLGLHQGLSRYTIGQRHGLGIAASRRLYVIARNPSGNELVVGGPEELCCSEVALDETSYFGDAPCSPFEATVQVRHRDPGTRALVTPGRAGQAALRFIEPARGVAPGQAAVFYSGDRLLGGGWIARGTQAILPRVARRAPARAAVAK
ncbi:MAG: tRNA 2-thiouridine(34) synthase MnmA [Acidobacteriota bacterium]